jgi:hypothetical protein
MKACVVALAVLALAGPAGATVGGCHSIQGGFVAVSLTPFSAECPSFFCTAGNLSGDLAGTYFFQAYDVAANGDLLGHSTITRTNGAVIHGNDTSHLNGDGTFVTTVNFVGGTRQFAHTTGQLVAPGHFTASGTEGTYSGQYCLGS